MVTLEQIIDETMDVVLSGDTTILNILQNQYKTSSITNIEKSPVGCFVEFEISGNATKIDKKSAYIGDVFIECEQLNSEIGVILFVEEGVISMLEFYTYGDDEMPERFEKYRFYYENGQRDLETYIK